MVVLDMHLQQKAVQPIIICLLVDQSRSGISSQQQQILICWAILDVFNQIFLITLPNLTPSQPQLGGYCDIKLRMLIVC